MSKHAARQTALTALTALNHVPVMVAPRHTAQIADSFRQMMSCDDDEYMENAEAGMRDMLCAAYGVGPASAEKPFAFAQGTAIIPIHGTLINRYGGYYFGYVTGYQFIRRQVAMALADDDVERILFDVNSGGGQAAGCFELADELFEYRGQKPTMAIVDSNCFSAAYALASSVDKVVVTPSGGAGSIGVIAMHVDVSKALDDYGVKITLITAGEHKADGNPFEPLSEDVRAEFQASVDQSYDAFVALVARNRGLDEKIVRDTEARCYSAQDALALGLIDAVAAPSRAITDFIYGPSGSEEETIEDDDMSGLNKANSPKPENEQSASAAASEEQLAAARQEGATAMQARVQGILGCEAAASRPKMAQHLAFKTSMSVEEATAMLEVAGVETSASKSDAPAADKKADEPTNFMKAMDTDSHPNVGPNGTDAKAEEEGSLMASLSKSGFTFE